MRPEEQTPIYKKAREIQQLVVSLITLIKESELPYADDIDLELIQNQLVAMELNAAEIPALIASASHPHSPYDYNMENAVYIKRAAHDLMGDAIYIEDLGLKDIDYLDLLHEEIEAFRLLFIAWVKSFELWKYDDEDWGLFNPEGIKLVYLPDDDEDEDDDEFIDDDEDEDV